MKAEVVSAETISTLQSLRPARAKTFVTKWNECHHLLICFCKNHRQINKHPLVITACERSGKWSTVGQKVRWAER